jgi:hypothetical protein
MIPMTINHLFVKSTTRFDHVPVRDLAICARAFRSLANRYEVIDFFQALLDASLKLAHACMIFNAEATPEWCKPFEEDGNDAESHSNMSGLSVPPPAIHSTVIGFQDASLARGYIKLDPGMVLFRQGVESSKLSFDAVDVW